MLWAISNWDTMFGSSPPCSLQLELILSPAMREALRELGYRDAYHYSSCALENPRDCEMWVDAFRAKYEGQGEFEKEQWDQLLGHCMVRVSHLLGPIDPP